MWMCNSIKVNKSWPTLSYLCIKRPIYISVNQLIQCWWGCHNLSVRPGACVVIVASVARAGCDGDAWLTEMSQYSMGNIKMWQLTWHLCHRKFTIGNHLNIVSRECHIYWGGLMLSWWQWQSCSDVCWINFNCWLRILFVFELKTCPVRCVSRRQHFPKLKSWSKKYFSYFLSNIIPVDGGCYLFSTATPSNWYICWSCQFVLTNGWNFTPATSNLNIM